MINEKEKALAEELWEGIVKGLESISDGEEVTFDIYRYKEWFCQRSNIRWHSYCWLCDNFKNNTHQNPCSLCPLYIYDHNMRCTDQGSLYDKADSYYDSKAAEKILEVIRGVQVC